MVKYHLIALIVQIGFTCIDSLGFVCSCSAFSLFNFFLTLDVSLLYRRCAVCVIACNTSLLMIQLREVELVRLCLKHFRQQGYDTAFKALQEQTNVILEDPMMSELHTSLVVQGDFQKAENFIEKAINGE